MQTKKNYRSIILTNRPFLLFIMSQGISSLGDTFHLVSITAMIFHYTGSGIYAGFGLICMPLCSLVLAPFAGGLSDIFPEKYVLIAVDFLRGIAAVLFIFSKNMISIYALLFVFAVLNVFYGPAYRKITACLLRNDELVAGNSLLSSVGGATYLVGPLVAGVIVGICGVNSAFIINSISFIYSAFQIMFIKVRNKPRNSQHAVGRHFFRDVLLEIKKGSRYFFKTQQIKELSIASTVICFTGSCINFAFYPFAFDILKVTAKGWAFIISVIGGASLLAPFVSTTLERIVNKSVLIFIYIQFLIIAGIWFFYGVTEDLATVILLLALEGITSTLLWIFFSAQLQLVTKRNFLGRVAGINDIFNNAGKLMGIGFAFILLKTFSPGVIFIISSFGLSLFALFKIFTLIFLSRERGRP